MSKITSVVLAVALTALAAGFWLKSGVSETSAESRSQPVQALSVYDLHLRADVKTMPVQKMHDMSFVFAGTD
jgi:hypothetical protein